MPLKFLRKMLPQASDYRVPEGQRVYAIGDIHGRLDLLDLLLGLIDADDRQRESAETSLIFLGDLVDRGPDSKGVVERVLELSRSRPLVHVLRGNHEEVFVRAARGDARAARHLIRMGGGPTVISYGIAPEDYEQLTFEEMTERLAALVPPEHLDFIDGFHRWVEIGDYLFVHAGIRPGVPLEEQLDSDLNWIREDFLSSRDSFGHMVVHGHTIFEKVEIRSNRIGIDTGAYETGRLTAIGLEGAERWFLST